MNFYIHSKDDLERIIHKTVEKAVTDSLPTAIRKATRQQFVTTTQVMDILQCSRRHVQHLRDSGRLQYRQNGRVIRYDIDEVLAYLNRGKVNTTQ